MDFRRSDCTYAKGSPSERDDQRDWQIDGHTDTYYSEPPQNSAADRARRPHPTLHDDV